MRKVVVGAMEFRGLVNLVSIVWHLHIMMGFLLYGFLECLSWLR